MLRAFAALAFALAFGCIEPAETPPAEHTLFSDARARVRLRTGAASGFPDPAGPWFIEVERADERERVLSGQAQVQGLAARARATRLPSGDLAVAVFDDLCAVSAGRAICADTRRRRAPRALREALSWRAEDPLASPRERIHAALALEAHDRAAALTALERIAEEPLHGDPVLPPMVRARIAWLRDDTAELRALQKELPDARNAVVIGLARVCMLREAVRAELPTRPDSVVRAAEDALERCPPRR